MTDWLRVLGYTVLGLLLLLGLLGASWVAWSRRKLRTFRLTEAQLKAVQDSQRGKRPYWTEPKGDPGDVEH